MPLNPATLPKERILAIWKDVVDDKANDDEEGARDSRREQRVVPPKVFDRLHFGFRFRVWRLGIFKFWKSSMSAWE